MRTRPRPDASDVQTRKPRVRPRIAQEPPRGVPTPKPVRKPRNTPVSGKGWEELAGTPYDVYENGAPLHADMLGVGKGDRTLGYLRTGSEGRAAYKRNAAGEFTFVGWHKSFISAFRAVVGK